MNGHLDIFVPSVENDFGQDVFLPTDPWTLIKTGKIANVPIMGGVMLQEGHSFAESMYIMNIILINTLLIYDKRFLTK